MQLHDAHITIELARPIRNRVAYGALKAIRPGNATLLAHMLDDAIIVRGKNPERTEFIQTHERLNLTNSRGVVKSFARVNDEGIEVSAELASKLHVLLVRGGIDAE